MTAGLIAVWAAGGGARWSDEHRAEILWRGQAGPPTARGPSDGAAEPIAGGDTCPYLPESRQLRETLPKLPAAQAAAALDRYSATHDNPEGCEAADIDSRLALLEARQFHAIEGRRQIEVLGQKTDTLTGATLVAHIHRRRRILSDQNHG